MEVNIKPSPKKKTDQGRLEKALSAIGELSTNLKYYTAWDWSGFRATVDPTPQTRVLDNIEKIEPIIAGGFSRDLRLGLDFDDIDIYVPHKFSVTNFFKAIGCIPELLTPVVTTGKTEEGLKEEEAKLIETLNTTDSDEERKEAYNSLCEIDKSTGKTLYNPSERGLKLVFKFIYKGLTFNMMLMNETPVEKTFEEFVMESFNCCLARTFLRLDGSQYFSDDFELAVKTKRMYIERIDFSQKYVNKMAKYFPDYTINIVEPLVNTYGKEPEKKEELPSNEENPALPVENQVNKSSKDFLYEFVGTWSEDNHATSGSLTVE